MFDYVISLREGIMDAWGGIIGAMKNSGKSKLILCRGHEFFFIPLTICLLIAQVFQPYVQSVFELLNAIANDMNRSEALMRASMGVIG
jgi:importin subunit beta-1